MDLSALSLQKLSREKRERQPNWTEPEKQLLLSLTQMHKAILENKGSDTMTIKRKSEAWDEIAVRMKTAGFNRSKERLKQQLGRIRAADAKKFKDAIEKNSTKEQVGGLNDSGNHSMIEENKPLKPQLSDNQMKYSSNYIDPLPTPLSFQEHQYIKSEDTSLVGGNDCSQHEIQTNSRSYIKPNIINYSIMNAYKNKQIVQRSKMVDNMHFKLQNVQSLAETDYSAHTGSIGKDGCVSEAKGIGATDVTSTIPCSTLSNIKTSALRMESNQISDSVNDENADVNCQKQQTRKRRLRNVRSGRIRSAYTKEHGLRQLYLYRVAVERERLRSLRLQQKRDRILYRKDIEIQNLKLQILRNLTNQNRESNSINF